MARWLLAAWVVLGAVFWGGTPALAAAPWLVLVYGPPLDRPVLLDNWSDNFALLGDEAADIQPTELSYRSLTWRSSGDRSGTTTSRAASRSIRCGRNKPTSLGGFILASAARMRCLCWIPFLGQARQCGACRRGA